MSSQPGDYIGQGLTYYFNTTTASIRPTSFNGSYMTFAVTTPGYAEWWYVDIAAAPGQPLVVGSYPNAVRAAFRGTGQPGLDVSGDGRGCNTLTGSFTVLEAVYGANNAVLQFDATFEQHCEGATPALIGEIRYDAFTAASYHAIAPVRLLDTRSGNGLSGKLNANTPRTFQVTGRGGIPANASAVTGNVTVVNSTAGWAVFLGPVATAAPTTSTINFASGEVTGNGLTVGLSATGTLSATYISTAGNTTDLVFDVTGYFMLDSTGATYHPMAPARLLDSRSGNGLSGKLVANTPRTFAVAGRGGIPANASAVTGNVTIVSPTNGWAVYLGPTAMAAPTTSTLNFNTGEVKGNNLTVALGSGGTLSATYISTSGHTTDLVFDVTGYYTPDATGVRFVPLTPARLLDTRSGNGLTGVLNANNANTFQVIGRGGVPINASAVTGNVTVVNQTAGWAVFLGPNATAAPTTSTVNFLVGQVKGNGLTVALGPGGTLSATYMSTEGNTTDLVFDVTGYFVPYQVG